jgi:hypothetical protein
MNDNTMGVLIALINAFFIYLIIKDKRKK